MVKRAVAAGVLTGRLGEPWSQCPFSDPTLVMAWRLGWARGRAQATVEEARGKGTGNGPR